MLTGVDQNVKSGVILIHDACVRIDHIHKLSRLLSSTSKSMRIWRISLAPMIDTTKHRHLLRLFPHGGVILLTDSMFLLRPTEALRLLMWFRLDMMQRKNDLTWKIALRPRIRTWLLDILDLYEVRIQEKILNLLGFLIIVMNAHFGLKDEVCILDTTRTSQKSVLTWSLEIGYES